MTHTVRIMINDVGELGAEFFCAEAEDAWCRRNAVGPRPGRPPRSCATASRRTSTSNTSGIPIPSIPTTGRRRIEYSQGPCPFRCRHIRITGPGTFEVHKGEDLEAD